MLKKNKKKSGKKDGFSVDIKSAGGGMMQMLSGFSVLRMTSMLGMVNVSFTKEELLKLNKKLICKRINYINKSAVIKSVKEEIKKCASEINGRMSIHTVIKKCAGIKLKLSAKQILTLILES